MTRAGEGFSDQFLNLFAAPQRPIQRWLGVLGLTSSRSVRPWLAELGYAAPSPRGSVIALPDGTHAMRYRLGLSEFVGTPSLVAEFTPPVQLSLACNAPIVTMEITMLGGKLWPLNVDTGRIEGIHDFAGTKICLPSGQFNFEDLIPNRSGSNAPQRQLGEAARYAEVRGLASFVIAHVQEQLGDR